MCGVKLKASTGSYGTFNHPEYELSILLLFSGGGGVEGYEHMVISVSQLIWPGTLA